MNTGGVLSVAFAISVLGAASVYGVLPRVPTLPAHAAEMNAPNRQLTPGDVVSTDRAIACAWERTPRPYETDRPAYEKLAREVFASYGIPYSQHGEFELDHFYPRCLGGADTAHNLWPQRCSRWSPTHLHCLAGPAADKDKDERRICRSVCGRNATMSIEAGQRFFAEGKWR